jgi:hypothetical protein
MRMKRLASTAVYSVVFLANVIFVYVIYGAATGNVEMEERELLKDLGCVG